MNNPRNMADSISQSVASLRRRFTALPEASKTERLRKRFTSAVEALEDLEREAYYEDQFVKD